MNTITNTTTTNRMNDIVARQRSSRLRDLAFSALLAIGIGLSLGAIRTANATTATEPAITAPAVATAPLAEVTSCQVELSC